MCLSEVAIVVVVFLAVVSWGLIAGSSKDASLGRWVHITRQHCNQYGVDILRRYGDSVRHMDEGDSSSLGVTVIEKVDKPK